MLLHFTSGECPANAEIGRAVERTGPWVTKWAKSATPPRDYEVHAPLADFLGVPRDWLIEGKGDPPRLDLWTVWLQERAADQTTSHTAKPGREIKELPASAFIPVPRSMPAAKKKRSG